MADLFIVQDDKPVILHDNDSRIVAVGGSTPGARGPQGLPGVVEDYEEVFTSATSWVVNHNLGRHPLVSVFSPGNVEVEAEIIHNSLNQFTVLFASAYAGKVRCI